MAFSEHGKRKSAPTWHLSKNFQCLLLHKTRIGLMYKMCRFEGNLMGLLCSKWGAMPAAKFCQREIFLCLLWSSSFLCLLYYSQKMSLPTHFWPLLPQAINIFYNQALIEISWHFFVTGYFFQLCQWPMNIDHFPKMPQLKKTYVLPIEAVLRFHTLKLNRLKTKQ